MLCKLKPDLASLAHQGLAAPTTNLLVPSSALVTCGLLTENHEALQMVGWWLQGLLSAALSRRTLQMRNQAVPL